MAGCVKLFPVSPVALEEQRIQERRKDREKNGRKLASWDVKKLEHIEAFYAGQSTEDAVLAEIRAQNSRRDAWMKKNGYGRR